VRVLLDHNLPHSLRTSLGKLCDHEIFTASYMGWGDLRNSELLTATEQKGFEVFVTGDQSLVHEQNLRGRRLAVIALSANNWPIIKNRVPDILAAIDAATPGSFNMLNCGEFRR